MNILAVIPAKGRSRGLKRKNIKPLLGKPMIYYTIQAAKESKLLDRIVCSTEDPEIGSIVKGYNIEVVQRPESLAQDNIRIDEPLRQAVKELEEKQGYKPDAVVLLYPNIAVRKQGIIDKTINKFLDTGADAVITVEDIGQFHPNWLLKIDESEKVELYSPTKIYTRQELPKYYLHDGAVVVVKKDVLMRDNGDNPLYPYLGNDIRAVIQAPEDVIDVDNEYDFLLAESILKKKNE